MDYNELLNRFNGHVRDGKSNEWLNGYARALIDVRDSQPTIDVPKRYQRKYPHLDRSQVAKLNWRNRKAKQPA